MAEEWITSREAAELLGIPQPNFLHYPKTGQVAIQPGSKAPRRMYSREDTLKIKRFLRERRPAPDPIMIDWLLSEDIPAGLKLDHQVYGEEIDLAEAVVYQGWRKHNRQITLAVFSLDRQECYASLQVIPVVEPLALDVLAGRRTESSINPDEIRAYDTPGAYTLLVTSAVCLPDRPLLLFELLSRYMQFWIDMYPEKYIRKVYAQAMSERGVMLVQHLFMSPRYDLAHNAYELDISRPSASRIIRKFKQQLEEKAPLPEALQKPPVVLPPVTAPTTRPTRPARPQMAQEEGTIDLTAMAKLLDVSRSTLRAWLAEYNLPHDSIDNPARPSEKKRTFTKEHQEHILTWYAANKKKS